MFDDYTRLTEGQKCPVSAIEIISGEQIRTPDSEHPKPFLIIFFSSNCSHCNKALYFIECKIVNSVGNRMKIVSIGRNHQIDDIVKLKEDKKWTSSMAADPDASIYNLFAEKIIPRAYLFSSEGELIYQVRGYNDEGYLALKEILLDL